MKFIKYIRRYVNKGNISNNQSQRVTKHKLQYPHVPDRMTHQQERNREADF